MQNVIFFIIKSLDELGPQGRLTKARAGPRTQRVLIEVFTDRPPIRSSHRPDSNPKIEIYILCSHRYQPELLSVKVIKLTCSIVEKDYMIEGF